MSDHLPANQRAKLNRLLDMIPDEDTGAPGPLRNNSRGRGTRRTRGAGRPIHQQNELGVLAHAFDRFAQAIPVAAPATPTFAVCELNATVTALQNTIEADRVEHRRQRDEWMTDRAAFLAEREQADRQRAELQRQLDDAQRRIERNAILMFDDLVDAIAASLRGPFNQQINILVQGPELAAAIHEYLDRQVPPANNPRNA